MAGSAGACYAAGMRRMLPTLVTVLALAAASGCGVEPEPLDNAPPELLLRSPRIAPVGVPVTLDATGSSDDQGIVVYRVQFGDGSAELELSGPVFTHTYQQPARYSLQVVALDDAGARASVQRQLTVVERYWPPYCDDSLPCEGDAVCDEGECFDEGTTGRF